MGERITYRCDCGYEKQLDLGSGLHAINLNMVRRFFPDEASLISENRSDVISYELSNTLAECHTCKDLFAAPSLKYVWDGTHTAVLNVCAHCGGCMTIHADHKNVSCPKCGKVMTIFTNGHWD